MSDYNWDEIPTVDEFAYLVGKSHTFDDGDKLEVIQVKRRDDGPWITYMTHQGPGIPRKLMLRFDQFHELYGHLFES